MFAYCLNNPVALSDASGAVAKVCLTADSAIEDSPWREIGRGGASSRAVAAPKDYIKDQNAPGVGSLRLGLATVSHGGCGAIATYNALITLGEDVSFYEVVNYYSFGRTCAAGMLGILPRHVANYFKGKGYTVVVTDNCTLIDEYSQTADACILWYTWPETYGFIKAFGAHFVHYRKNNGSYIAYNTGYNGVERFSGPSSFAYSDGNDFAIGIFIYK